MGRASPVTERRAIDALMGLFAREGFARVEPAVLQPADVFVDLSGEDIRRRLFALQDAAGAELCLRPEYTIPVCREHLARHGEAPAAYAYGGPVFRMRQGEAGEFLQAGIESIGRPDAAAADADILGIAVEGLDRLGCADTRVRLGDMGLLDALVDALGLSPSGKRRIVRAIVSGQGLGGLADPGDGAAHAVRVLVADAGLNLAAAVEAFEERNGFMAARGLDLAGFTFQAGFARNHDYYTGFIF